MNQINLLTNYNLWANKRIANWLLSNKKEKLEELCKSSFTTITLTASHICDAEILYLSILKQNEFQKAGENSTDHVISRLTEQSEEFNQYVSQLDESKLADLRTVQFKFLSGTFEQRFLIQHCMNHSTYHRGQIVTMGHQLNLTKAPSTDLLFYLNETSLTLKNN